MRLRDVQYILTKAELPETVRVERFPAAPGTPDTKIHAANKLKRALRILGQVPALETAVTSIQKHRTFMGQSGDTVVGIRSDLDPLVLQLSSLCRVVSLFRQILDQALPPEESTQLVLKIQEPRDLGNLEAQVGDIRRFFDILAKIEVEDESGERVALHPAVQAFDSGSFYIELLLHSVAAIGIVGAVMHAAYKAVVVWESWKQAQARVITAGALVKEVQSIAQHNDLIRAALVDNAVKELKTTGRFSKVSGEREAALRAAIQQGTEMLEKRMIFLPPPSAPSDILTSFPSPKVIERLLSNDQVKLIEASIEEDTAEPVEHVEEQEEGDENKNDQT